MSLVGTAHIMMFVVNNSVFANQPRFPTLGVQMFVTPSLDRPFGTCLVKLLLLLDWIRQYKQFACFIMGLQLTSPATVPRFFQPFVDALAPRPRGPHTVRFPQGCATR